MFGGVPSDGSESKDQSGTKAGVQAIDGTLGVQVPLGLVLDQLIIVQTIVSQPAMSVKE